MERDTYVQEWLQTDIEAVVRGAGFAIIESRSFREGRWTLPTAQHPCAQVSLEELTSPHLCCPAVKAPHILGD
jgi:hypothetical protein